MTLYLYTDSPLNDTYQDVYANRTFGITSMGSTCTTVRDCQFYLQTEGDLNLELPGYKDIPNYMAYGEEGGSSSLDDFLFYFITSYEMFNGVARIHYKLDVWMSYCADPDGFSKAFGVRNGKRILASTVIGDRGDFITPPAFVGDTKIERIPMYNAGGVVDYSDRYVVMYTGYMYTGVRDNGDVSEATPFYGYIMDCEVNKSYRGSNQLPASAVISPMIKMYTSYEDAVDAAGKLYSYTSSARYSVLMETGGSESCYCQISRSYIFPATFFYQLNLYQTSSLYDWVYEDSTNIVHSVLEWIENTSTAFNYDELNMAVFLKGNISGYTNPYTYSRTYEYTQFKDGYVLQKLGTLQHQLDVPYSVLKEGGVKLTIETFLSTTNFTVLLKAFGQTVDITDEFEFSLNFTPESALTAVQRKNLAKQDAISMAGSLIGAGANIGTSIATGNVSGVISGAIGGVSAIASYATKRKAEYSSITNAPSSTDTGTQYYGLCAIYSEAGNQDDVQREYESYGISVDYTEDEISLDDTLSYNVVAYEDVTVYGGMPEQYKRDIRGILQNGVRIWNTIDTIGTPRSRLTLKDITEL